MASVAFSTSLLLALIAIVSYGSCLERPTLNGTTIEWKDKFDEEGNEGSGLQTEYDAKGLQPWYDFSISFISTVLSKDPYDLVFKAKAGTLMDNIKDDIILGYALGLVICVGIGVLFIVVMPIVGLCFCCCRCCGNCGGEMSQKDNPNNNCKRAVFGVVLLMITLLMFTGVLLTFVCNDRMSDTVDGAVDTSTGILNEAILFVNRTVGEVDKLLRVDFSFVANLLRSDISDANLTTLVGDPLLEELETVTVQPIEAVKTLSGQTKEMRDQLQVITNNSESLSRLTEELESGLNESRRNLSEIQNECRNSTLNGSDVCSSQAFNPSLLATEANFTNLPNVTEQLSNIQDVVNQDFEKRAQEGLNELRDIPNTIINDTRETREDIRRQISDASDTIEKMRKDLRKIADDDVIAKVMTWRDDDVPKYKEELTHYDHYRWIAGVGLTCMLLLIVVLMALGLMCGVCGYTKDATPTTRGTVSNMGGLSLMAATGFCFIFASLLMLLTTICFIIGAPAQTVCKSIQSGELFDEVIDKSEFWGSDGNVLSKAFFGEDNKDITFSIGAFLRNCRNNKPLFVSGPFDQAFNVSSRLDIKELLGNDSTQQFDKLKVNLSDVTIFSNDTETSLTDLRDSGVDEIEFDAFLNETSKSITAVDLSARADNLTTLALKFQDLGNNGSGEAYILGNKTLATAQGLRDLDADVVSSMSNLSTELGKNVEGLRQIGSNLKTIANDTLRKAREAEDYLHANSSKNINEIVTTFTDRVLGWGFQFTDHVQDLLNNHLARCKPIANIYDATIVFICNQALYPFNGFWFSIGFCLFFFIPAIIFCVKLAKHYRRMHYESDFDQGMDAEMYEMGHHYPPPAYGSEKKSWANPKNSVYPQAPPART